MFLSSYAGRSLAPALLGLLLSAPLSAALTSDEQAMLARVDDGRIAATVSRLCSDEFAGRRAGSPAADGAADYISGRYAEMGLTKILASGVEGYRQPLTMRYSLVRTEEDIQATLRYQSADGKAWRTRSFAYRGYNGRGGITLDTTLVFVGHGVCDAESGFDDYRGLDAKGKVVVWLQGAPSSLKSRRGISTAQKMATAYARGAVGCIAVMVPGNDETGVTDVGLAGSIADFPCLSVDPSFARAMLAGTGVGLDGRAPARDLVRRVSLSVPAICDPKRATSNLLAIIPGSDPSAAGEVVVVGAHYDHLGADGTRLFRGADDNASGTSVVIEAARVLSGWGTRPRRTIVFACWTGEECGLIGSAYFAAHPPFPLRNIVSNIELDMVGAGRPGEFMTTGAQAYPLHYRWIAGSASDLGYTLKPDAVKGASDHLSFSRRGVPTSLLYSAGEHPFYHSTGDTPQSLNRGTLSATARLTILSVWRAANASPSEVSGTGDSSTSVGADGHV